MAKYENWQQAVQQMPSENWDAIYEIISRKIPELRPYLQEMSGWNHQVTDALREADTLLGMGGGGIIGFGNIEYVYALFNERDLPEDQRPSNDWTYLQPGESDGLLWVSAQPSPTEARPYVFRAERGITAETTPGDEVTGDWTIPILIVQPGTSGLPGRSGVGREIIYAVTDMATIGVDFWPLNRWWYRVGGVTGAGSHPQRPTGGEDQESHTPMGWTRDVLTLIRFFTDDDYRIFRSQRLMTFRNGVFRSAMAWSDVIVWEGGDVGSDFDQVDYIYTRGTSAPARPMLGRNDENHLPSGYTRNDTTPTATEDVYRSQRTRIYKDREFQGATGWTEPELWIGRTGRDDEQTQTDRHFVEYIYREFEIGEDRPLLRWIPERPVLTARFPFLFRSERQIVGEPEPFSDVQAEWTVPRLAAHFAEDGADGAGYEFIFAVYNDDTIPTSKWPQNGWAYDAPGVSDGLQWHDGAPNATVSNPFLFISQRIITGSTGLLVTIVEQWTEPTLISKLGNDGLGFERVFAAYDENTIPTALRPSNDWGYDTPGIVRSGADTLQWHDDIPDLTVDAPFLFRARRAIMGIPTVGDTVEADWQVPRVISHFGADGQDGIGTDGTPGAGYEFIYAIYDADTIPAGLRPDNAWGYDQPATVTSGVLALRWYDNVPGVTPTMRFLFQSRRRVRGSPDAGDAITDDWTNPSLISRFGEDGEPGDPGPPGIGYEFIYAVFNQDSIPANLRPSNGWGYDQPTGIILPGGVQITWSDDVPDVTENLRYLFQARRQIIGAPEAGDSVTADWEAPALISHFGEDGDARAGVGHEFIYAVYPTNTIPADLRPDNTWGYDQPGTVTDGTNSLQWHDDVTDVSATNPFLFQSRRQVEGTPSTGDEVTADWSDPALISHFGQDGTDGSPGLGYELIYAAHDADSIPENLRPDNAWGYDQPTTVSAGGASLEWHDDVPGLTASTRYLFQSRRLVVGSPNVGDTVTADWEAPSLVSHFGQDGDGIEGQPGVGQEFIYAVYGEDAIPAGLRPDNDWGYDSPSTVSDAGASLQWHDDVPGVTSEAPYLFQSRRLVLGSPDVGDAIADEWDDPALISRFGEDGEPGDPGADGIGFEYIFAVHDEGTLDAGFRPLDTWGYDQPGTVTSGGESVTWHDDVPSVTAESAYLFQSRRRIIGAPEVGDTVVNTWEVPALIAHFGQDGTDGIGRDGQPGTGVEFIYAAYPTLALPAGLFPDNDWGFDQPATVTTGVAPDEITLQWHDGVPGYGNLDRVIFISQRDVVGTPAVGDAVPAEWTTPTILSTRGTDASGEEHIYARYSSGVLPAGLRPDNTWGYDSPGVVTTGTSPNEITLEWHDDAPSLSATFPFLFRARRKITGAPDVGDEVDNAWAEPTVVAHWGQDAAGLETIWCLYLQTTLPGGAFPDNDWPYNQPGVAGTVTWYDNVQETTEAIPFLFVSSRRITGAPVSGQAKQPEWGSWSTPVRVGIYTTDGSGFEEIFVSYNRRDLPAQYAPDNTWGFDQPGDVGSPAIRWSDEPPALSPARPFLFWSRRRILGAPSVGDAVDALWSEPQLIGVDGEPDPAAFLTFPYASSFVYDLRRNNFGVGVDAGEWIATGEVDTWGTIPTLTFSARDAKGISPATHFMSRSFVEGEVRLGLRRDVDGNANVVGFRATGVPVPVLNGAAYRIPVVRIRGEDIGDITNVAPPLDSDYRVRLMIGALDLDEHHVRKAGVFWQKIEPDLAEELEDVGCANDWPDAAILLADSITPGENVEGDRVYLYHGDDISKREWDGNSWECFVDSIVDAPSVGPGMQLVRLHPDVRQTVLLWKSSASDGLRIAVKQITGDPGNLSRPILSAWTGIVLGEGDRIVDDNGTPQFDILEIMGQAGSGIAVSQHFYVEWIPFEGEENIRRDRISKRVFLGAVAGSAPTASDPEEPEPAPRGGPVAECDISRNRAGTVIYLRSIGPSSDGGNDVRGTLLPIRILAINGLKNPLSEPGSDTSFDSTRANRYPIIDAGGDQTVETGSQVILTATASDPDGTIEAVRWEQVIIRDDAGQPVDDVVFSRVSVSGRSVVFTAPARPTILHFRFSARDNDGAETFERIAITVAGTFTDQRIIFIKSPLMPNRPTGGQSEQEHLPAGWTRSTALQPDNQNAVWVSRRTRTFSASEFVTATLWTVPELHAATTGEPSPPRNVLKNQLTATRVTVSWDAPERGLTPVTYDVEREEVTRDPDGGEIFTWIRFASDIPDRAVTTEETETVLVASRMRVRAHNQHGTSEWAGAVDSTAGNVHTDEDHLYRLGPYTLPPPGGENDELHTPQGFTRDRPTPTIADPAMQAWTRTRTYVSSVFRQATHWVPDFNEIVRVIYRTSATAPPTPQGGINEEHHLPTPWQLHSLEPSRLLAVYRSFRIETYDPEFHRATQWMLPVLIRERLPGNTDPPTDVMVFLSDVNGVPHFRLQWQVNEGSALVSFQFRVLTASALIPGVPWTGIGQVNGTGTEADPFVADLTDLGYRYSGPLAVLSFHVRGVAPDSTFTRDVQASPLVHLSGASSPNLEIISHADLVVRPGATGEYLVRLDRFPITNTKVYLVSDSPAFVLREAGQAGDYSPRYDYVHPAPGWDVDHAIDWLARDVEYIYAVFNEETLPEQLEPDNAWGYGQPGTVTMGTSPNEVTLQWQTALPSASLNANTPFAFRAWRQIPSTPTPGAVPNVGDAVTAEWEPPEVAFRYAADNDRLDYGGRPDTDIEYVYAVWVSANRPFGFAIPTALRPDNDWGYESPGPRTSGTQTVTWLDDIPDVISDADWLLRCEREILGNPAVGDPIDDDWSAPVILERYEFMYTSFNAAAIPSRPLWPSPAWRYQMPDTRTDGPLFAEWNNDVPVLTAERPYLLQSRRRLTGTPSPGDTVTTFAWSEPELLFNIAVDGHPTFEDVVVTFTADTERAGRVRDVRTRNVRILGLDHLEPPKVYAEGRANHVILTWSEVLLATRYQIRYRLGTNGVLTDWLEQQGPDDERMEVISAPREELRVGSIFQVRALDYPEGGVGHESEASLSLFTTDFVDPPSPLPVIILTSARPTAGEAGAVTLMWEYGAHIVRYQYRLKLATVPVWSDADWTDMTNHPHSSEIIRGLLPGVEYEFQVRGLDYGLTGTGNASPPSATAHAVPGGV